MRRLLRNISGYPLEIRRYHVVVPPGWSIDIAELVDADGPYDPDKHGVVTGFELIDDEPEDAGSKTRPSSKTKTSSAGEEQTK